MSNEITETEPLLRVNELTVEFRAPDRDVRAVKSVSFTARRGEMLAIVGESGSGKSVLGLSLIGLIPEPGRIADGSIELGGVDLTRLSEDEMRRLRGSKISMIFQDPLTSLNPYLSIGKQMCEVTRLHRGLSAEQARQAAIDALSIVGIPDADRRIDQFPHQFSGGMRQRVMIATALSCEPELVIADEPTTALDATIQSQILDLLVELQRRSASTVILITHDLDLVRDRADSVLVMYAGKIYEKADAKDLTRRPANPYTVALMRCLSDHTDGGELYQIPGMPPDLGDAAPGCAFAPRCERAEGVCRTDDPPFVEVDEGHFSRCHFATKIFELTSSKGDGQQ